MILESFIQPEEKSPEFKVWIKPLSFSLVASVREQIAKKEGPDKEDMILGVAKPILLNYIDRVEGLQINGKDISSASEFFDWAPAEYAQKVVDFVLKKLTPSEEEKKSSS